MSDPSGDMDLLAYANRRVGTVLRGKYRLDAVLGIGGMAVVYKATHRNQAEFAVKILHPELSIREDVKSRFLREGYAANSVKHPSAVLVVDDDVAEDGAAFLVMELLDGESVDALLTRLGGRVPLRAGVAIVSQLLEVLAAAHAKGIVHRDVKPANLFVTRDGTVKVLDFGIARARDAAVSGAQITGTGVMLGTPAFMPPEQALGKANEVDGQSDVWAAGATLFTLLSGQLVHEGDTGAQLLILAATTPARSLTTVAPSVPQPISAVTERALAFDKSARFPTAEAMRQALEAATIAVLRQAPSREMLASALRETNAALAATGFDATMHAGHSPPGVAPVAQGAAAAGPPGAPGTSPQGIAAPPQGMGAPGSSSHDAPPHAYGPPPAHAVSGYGPPPGQAYGPPPNGGRPTAHSPGGMPGQTTAQPIVSSRHPSIPGVRSSKRITVSLVAVLAMALGVGGIVLWRSMAPGAKPETAAQRISTSSTHIPTSAASSPGIVASASTAPAEASAAKVSAPSTSSGTSVATAKSTASSASPSAPSPGSSPTQPGAGAGASTTTPVAIPSPGRPAGVASAPRPTTPTPTVTAASPAPKPSPSPPPSAGVALPPPTNPGTPTSPASPKIKPNCNPNYYFDAHGEKHFKRECF